MLLPGVVAELSAGALRAERHRRSVVVEVGGSKLADGRQRPLRARTDGGTRESRLPTCLPRACLEDVFQLLVVGLHLTLDRALYQRLGELEEAAGLTLEDDPDIRPPIGRF